MMGSRMSESRSSNTTSFIYRNNKSDVSPKVGSVEYRDYSVKKPLLKIGSNNYVDTYSIFWWMLMIWLIIIYINIYRINWWAYLCNSIGYCLFIHKPNSHAYSWRSLRCILDYQSLIGLWYWKESILVRLLQFCIRHWGEVRCFWGIPPEIIYFIPMSNISVALSSNYHWLNPNSASRSYSLLIIFG